MSSETATARFADGAPLEPVNPSAATLELLRNRRSAKWALIREPGPSEEELQTLLAIASRVPDHGKLAPWRFIVIEGKAREALGEVLAEAWQKKDPSAPEERLSLERQRFANMPVTVCVVSHVQEMHKIPAWEQTLSSAAACTTLLIAANAMGYAGSWITEWFGYDSNVCAALGLKPMERIAGFVGLGSIDQVQERRRPRLEDLVTRWTG